MIIDVWAQQPTLRHAQSPIFDSLRRWTKQPVPEAASPVSTLIASMDAAGVDLSLISAWQSPRFDLITNDEVAAFVAEAPDRLVGVGSVDISKPGEVFAEVQRCVEDLGFKAIRVLPWLAECPPTDRRFYPVFTACAELGVPFCTQIGHTGPLMPSEPGRPLYLDQVALDFPTLKIVGGHIGYPWTEEAIAVATKHEIVWAIIGGLFVLEAVSVIVQVASFKLTGKRVFKMAPIHHHFEQKGWREPTVVMRCWIIAVIVVIVLLILLAVALVCVAKSRRLLCFKGYSQAPAADVEVAATTTRAPIIKKMKKKNEDSSSHGSKTDDERPEADKNVGDRVD